MPVRILKDFQKKDLYTIPNIMSYIRLVLVPVFVTMYLRAETTSEYIGAASVVLVSTLTDFLDGFIARSLHQVTELGKLLDPVADKLTHAAIALCLISRYSLMAVVFGLMVVKEGYMLIMGIIKLKDGKKLSGAKWFGKVCTAVMYFVMFGLLLVVDMPVALANGLIWLCIVLMVFTLSMYIPVFRKM